MEFGFIGQAYEAASVTQDTQALINWYPEIDSAKSQGDRDHTAERGIMALYPTPGLVTRLQLSFGEVRGFHVMPGGQMLLTVSGSTVYRVDTGFNKVIIGNIGTAIGKVFFADTISGTEGSIAYLVDGVNRYTYTVNTQVLDNVGLLDGGFVGASVCDEVDNYIFYNRPETNQWGCTDLSSGVSNALNVGSKIGSTDNIVCLIADHRQVLVLGEETSERWVDVGSINFPFSPIPGTAMQHGCQAQNSVARLGEGIAFLAQDDRGTATVVTWGANFPAPSRISTFAIENSIQGYAVTSDAIGMSYTQAGHEFYVLTFPTADVTWVYDVSTQLWHRRAWRDPDSNVKHRHRANCLVPFAGAILAGDFENGKVYELSQSTYTDDGDPLVCVRRCRHLTKDLNRQFFHWLQIQFQPGVGLQEGQGDDPECVIRWSDDGGFTWSNDHVITLGKVGDYKHRAKITRMGWGRDRVFEVEMADPVYRVVVSANILTSDGAN